MPNPTISQLTINGGVYDIEDTVARNTAAGGIQLKGETSTPLTDMSTTNPIVINSESYTAVNQDAVFYNHKEFVFDGTYWHEFGDMTGLGDLAFKNDASGSFTPHGDVSAPTISVASAGATTTVNSITDVGTLPTLTMTVVDKNLTITFSQGTLPTKGSDQTVKTGDASYTATAPTFSGTQDTVTVS